jgi:hypothetical protein
VHNLSLAFFFPIIYICFAIALFVKKRMYGVGIGTTANSQVDLVVSQSDFSLIRDAKLSLCPPLDNFANFPHFNDQLHGRKSV